MDCYRACEVSQTQNEYSIPAPTRNMREFAGFRDAIDWANNNFTYWQVWHFRAGYEPRLMVQKLSWAVSSIVTKQ